MRRVLIVKTSSMGDVIHTLPALTDAKRACPDIVFDWVVEEGFAEIPAWHPAVDRVIPVAIRRWRKNIWGTMGSTEWKQFRNQLRKHHYDLVIDAQGLLKSAWLTRLVKAPAAGYDRKSVRESLAALFYQQKYSVSKELHAVERIRQLFAQALNYPVPESAKEGCALTAARGKYGIDPQRFCSRTPEKANVVFLHGTTRDDKHYPEVYWQQLAEMLAERGLRVRMVWGSKPEQARAKRIAAKVPSVEVLPRLNIQGVAGVLAQANAVVAVDTGLGHLTAALDIPAVSLYGPTKPGLIGAYGDNQVHLCATDYPAVSGAERVEPEVFAPLTPENVLKELDKQLQLTVQKPCCMAD
jgi:heptosyltransferase-1